MMLYGFYNDMWHLVSDDRELNEEKQYLLCSPLWWQRDKWVKEVEIEEFKESEYDKKYV